MRSNSSVLRTTSSTSLPRRAAVISMVWPCSIARRKSKSSIVDQGFTSVMSLGLAIEFRSENCPRGFAAEDSNAEFCQKYLALWKTVPERSSQSRATAELLCRYRTAIPVTSTFFCRRFRHSFTLAMRSSLFDTVRSKANSPHGAVLWK